MDACLSCPGTPQGQVKGDMVMEGLSPALQASTGGYRSILEQADQCIHVRIMYDHHWHCQ